MELCLKINDFAKLLKISFVLKNCKSVNIDYCAIHSMLWLCILVTGCRGQNTFLQLRNKMNLFLLILIKLDHGEGKGGGEGVY